MINRIRQGLVFIFGRYNLKNDIEVKKVLNTQEFKIFQNMGRYDKIHSYKLYLKVRKDSLLKNKKIYWKVALLHDCGKISPSLYKRAKKVLIGDKKLENHSELSYEKLKDIDFELANLVKIHHIFTEEKLMKRFQYLDDRS